MLLLPDCIPTDVWALELMMQFLDARDLMTLETVRADLVHVPAGGRFVAARVLDAAELAWFSRHEIPLQLLVERKEKALITIGGKPTAYCVTWWLNGKLHREEDLPAWELSNGFVRKWYRHDKLHRDGGRPAVEYGEDREWWVNGKRHRDGGEPAFVSVLSDVREWWVDGKRHRDGDEPAVIFSPAQLRQWWVNGQLHRDRQMPAVISSYTAEWWEFGVRMD